MLDDAVVQIGRADQVGADLDGLLPGDQPGCAGGLVALDGVRRLDLDVLPNAEAVGLLRALIGERVDADPVAARVLAGQCARLPLALRVAAELAVAQPGRPLAKLVAELEGVRDRLEVLDAGDDSRAVGRKRYP